MARESSVIIGSGINPLKKGVPIHPRTQNRHIGGSNVIVVNPEDSSAGGSGLVTAITLAGTAVQLPSIPLQGRRAISICNNSATDTCYIGFDLTVETGTGWPIAPKNTISLDINGEVIIYGVSAGGATDIRILELS